MDSYSRRQSARTYSSTSPQSTDNYQPGVDDVSYHYGSVSSSRLRCCRFRARLVPIPLAESARRAAEDLGSRSRYGKFHGSFCQRSGGHLSRSSLRSGRARSRPSGRIPDLEELDDRLQSDHGLVWTLCQPDDPCHERGRDIRVAKRPRGKSARHGSFPAHLSHAPANSASRAPRHPRTYRSTTTATMPALPKR